MSWNTGRSYSCLKSKASQEKRQKYLDDEADIKAKADAYDKGHLCGDDEAARGWPCNALVPPHIFDTSLRDQWQAAYIKGYNKRKASGSVLPLRV